jgi:hypothetical protein
MHKVPYNPHPVEQYLHHRQSSSIPSISTADGPSQLPLPILSSGMPALPFDGDRQSVLSTSSVGTVASFRADAPGSPRSSVLTQDSHLPGHWSTLVNVGGVAPLLRSPLRQPRRLPPIPTSGLSHPIGTETEDVKDRSIFFPSYPSTSTSGLTSAPSIGGRVQTLYEDGRMRLAGGPPGHEHDEVVMVGEREAVDDAEPVVSFDEPPPQYRVY